MMHGRKNIKLLKLVFVVYCVVHYNKNNILKDLHSSDIF